MNTMKRFFLILLSLCLCLAGCRQRDEREMTVKIPGVTTAEDRAAVRGALRPLGGVLHDSLVFDGTNHTLRLRYDSMQVAHKNIEIAIAEAGFDANEIKALKKGGK